MSETAERTAREKELDDRLRALAVEFHDLLAPDRDCFADPEDVEDYDRAMNSGGMYVRDAVLVTGWSALDPDASRLDWASSFPSGNSPAYAVAGLLICVTKEMLA